MQLEVTLMIGYKCGVMGLWSVLLSLPHTVGYVHSEYLSCTTPPQGFTAPPQGFTAQEVSLGTTHNHVVPFAYFFKSLIIDLLSFILRMNDKRYSLAIKPVVVGSARYLSLCRRILTVESRLSKDRKEKSWRRVKNHV